jgi:hypothetical protein
MKNRLKFKENLRVNRFKSSIKNGVEFKEKSKELADLISDEIKHFCKGLG